MTERKVKINGTYRHFKGSIMKVIAIAKDSEDLSLKVIYHHLDQPDELWVRDYEEFLSEVDKNKYSDVLQKYRFEEIDE